MFQEGIKIWPEFTLGKNNFKTKSMFQEGIKICAENTLKKIYLKQNPVGDQTMARVYSRKGHLKPNLCSRRGSKFVQRLP